MKFGINIIPSDSTLLVYFLFHEFFSSTTAVSRPALEPTQPPIQQEPGSHSLRGEVAGT